MKQFAAVLALAAMVSFGAWPLWRYLYVRSASAELHGRTKALVDANPQLQAAWTIALLDDVLTVAEAKVIVESAGEQLKDDEE
ncbi:MAG TPA: hypothetical protein PKC18_00365 [Lacipirellulaceae bacterium]|nr:hypothetical protein [Lacipirellulaceae bacterium]